MNILRLICSLSKAGKSIESLPCVAKLREFKRLQKHWEGYLVIRGSLKIKLNERAEIPE